MFGLKSFYGFAVLNRRMERIVCGSLNVAKFEIFIICFLFMLYEVLFLLYISYLCYAFHYISVYYMYIICFFILLNISISILFDFKIVTN